MTSPVHKPVKIPKTTTVKSTNHDVVIVANLKENDTQLANMIARFQANLSVQSRIINIQEYPFKGGCIGCFNCATDGICTKRSN